MNRVQVLTNNMRVCALTVLTFDRYQACCNPMEYKNKKVKSYVRKYLLLLVILPSAVCLSPLINNVRLLYLSGEDNSDAIFLAIVAVIQVGYNVTRYQIQTK